MQSFRCEHCRQKIAARDEYAGRRVRCPRCKEPVRVPSIEAAAAPAPAAPATTNVVEKPSPVAAKPVASPQGTPVFAHPSPQDFSSIFSAPLDELFESGGHDYSPEEQTQVLRPVHPVERRRLLSR